MICPYCKSGMLLQDSAVIYGKSYGPAFICANYPQCDTYVGTHKAGHMRGQPLGTPANAELRNARKILHAQFDPLWKECYLTRRVAYKMLSQAMNIPPEQCHIAMFDIERCRFAWKHVQDLRRKYYGHTKKGSSHARTQPSENATVVHMEDHEPQGQPGTPHTLSGVGGQRLSEEASPAHRMDEQAGA